MRADLPWWHQVDAITAEELTALYAAIPPRQDMLALVPPCDRLLDLGCANGATGAELKRLGRVKRVVGVELYAPAAGLAERVLDRVLAADIEALAPDAFDADYFDVILCADVLEHLRSPGRALRLATGWLKSDGRVIAHLPNASHHAVIRGLLRGHFDYTDGGVLDNGHLRFFGRANIEALFKSAGLQVDTIRPSLPKRLLELYRTPGYLVLASRA